MFATLHTSPQFYFTFCTVFYQYRRGLRVRIPYKSESGCLFTSSAKVVYISCDDYPSFLKFFTLQFTYMVFIYSKLMYTLLDVIRIYLKNISKKKSKSGFFMQYRENPNQIGMVGKSSLCEKKTKELNIDVMYSLWILPKWVGFFLPQSHIGQDSGFHAISGESRSDWDGWTVFFMWEEDKRTKYSERDVFIVDTT